MGTEHFILILAAEALVVCVFVSGLILLKNHNLLKLIKQLRARLQTSRESLRENMSQPSPPQIPYDERLDEQLADTIDYHHSLGSPQDIALDLDPDSPQDRRTAALRHAFLIAEKEATASGEHVNWNFLAGRYEQLISFHQDYAPEPTAHLQEDLNQAEHELQQARKRIDNLARFKTMYLELEERWERCKDKADGHYNELQSLAEKTEQPDNFRQLLDQYHSSYQDIDGFIENGSKGPEKNAPGAPADQQHELRRLRSMAADQHRIIRELQDKLSASSAVEEKAVIVESLQNELMKQARFLQESDTCIQLMEDELASANRQLTQLRDRANQAAPLKTEIKGLKEASETKEQIIGSLQQEVRRLNRKLKLAQETPPEDNQELRALRKGLSTLQAEYNELEEKFLSLKLKE